MSVGLQRDIGSFLATAFGMANVAAITGDTTGLNDSQFGASIDRLSQSRRYLSAKVLGLVNVVLAAASSGAVGRTATVELSLQDSADNTNWTDYVGDAAGLGASTDPVVTFPQTGITATASSTGLPTAGINYAPSRDIDLSRARRYIRTKTLVNVSSTSSGTNNGVTILGVGIVFGGADFVPAT